MDKMNILHFYQKTHFPHFGVEKKNFFAIVNYRPFHKHKGCDCAFNFNLLCYKI